MTINMISDSVIIEGNTPLYGEVSCGGAKNSSLPLIAAAISAPKGMILKGLSRANDVEVSLEIVRQLGAKVTEFNEELQICGEAIDTHIISFELGQKIRPIYYFLPALLNKLGAASMPSPGGCNIGERPIDLHLSCLEKIGVEIFTKKDMIEFVYRKRMAIDEIEIELPFPSRGVTIVLMLMAAFNESLSLKVVNANFSPECLHTAKALISAGASIQFLENSTIKINGSAKNDYSGRVRIDVPSDKIECAFFEAAGLITGGKILIANPPLEDMAVFHRHLLNMGFEVHFSDRGVFCSIPETVHDITPVEAVSSLDELGLDADFEPILIALFAHAKGVSFASDDINPGRHGNFIPYLRSAGMNIDELSSTSARIVGPTTFNAFEGEALDIRSGTALMLAALAAPGKSHLTGIKQIQRGYQGIFEKIRCLGAKIYDLRDSH